MKRWETVLQSHVNVTDDEMSTHESDDDGATVVNKKAMVLSCGARWMNDESQRQKRRCD